MPNIEKKLELAQRILRLRADLAAAESELAGEPAKPIRGRQHAAPSVSQRVLHMVQDAGPAGLARRDIIAVLPQEGAVHAALKVHSAAGRIVSKNGQWVMGRSERVTRPVAIQPQGDGFLAQ